MQKTRDIDFARAKIAHLYCEQKELTAGKLCILLYMMTVQRAKLAIFLIYNLIFFVTFSWLSTKIVGFCVSVELLFTGQMYLLLTILFVVYFFLMWKDIYSKNYHYYLHNTYRFVIKNTVFAIGAVLATSSVLINFDHSLQIKTLVFYLISGTLSFLLMHLTHYIWILYLCNLGYFQKKVLVIGRPDVRFPLVSYFQDVGNTRELVGSIFFEDEYWVFHHNSSDTKKLVRGLLDLRNIIISNYIGEVILFSGKRLRGEFLRSVANLCKAIRISYYLVPDISHLPVQQPWNKLFPYIPILERFTTARDSLTKMSIKRLIDIVVSFFGLLAFLPVGVVVALAIKKEDGGPIFYTGNRIGKNGSPVRFFKFRTMFVGADRQKEKLLQYNVRKNGPLFKMKNDPRMTRVGRFLRRFSLDEVPQLLNVLIGNMSLIGPRPHLPEEVATYTECDYLRLECMPGIVGLPQVSGRKDQIGFREWVDMDLEYRGNWSLQLDLKVMFRTVKLLLQPLLNGGSEPY